MSDKLRIYVKDEGIGISPENQLKLFTRFYRASDVQHKNITGFGIGLYLVSELVRLHDSRIEVDSKLGEGSVFYFHLDPKTPL